MTRVQIWAYVAPVTSYSALLTIVSEIMYIKACASASLLSTMPHKYYLLPPDLEDPLLLLLPELLLPPEDLLPELLLPDDPRL